jgi:hypothetical protein
VLSGTAKALVTAFLVLGVVGGGAYVVSTVSTVMHRHQTNQAVEHLNAAQRKLATSVEDFTTKASSCSSDPDPLGCLEQADAAFADANDEYVAAVDDIDPPSGTDAEFATLQLSAHLFAQALHELSAAESMDDYQAKIASTNLQWRGQQVDAAFAQLASMLNARI